MIQTLDLPHLLYQLPNPLTRAPVLLHLLLYFILFDYCKNVFDLKRAIQYRKANTLFHWQKMRFVIIFANEQNLYEFWSLNIITRSKKLDNKQATVQIPSHYTTVTQMSQSS